MNAPPPDNFKLLGYLQLRIAHGSFPNTNGITIYEADVYSAAPDVLVEFLYHAGGSTRYFFSPANFLGSGKRKRKVAGGADNCSWHSERGWRIVGPDGELAGGYARQLSYVMNTPLEETKRKSSGWCMTEIALERRGDGADQIVLCKVYKSNRTEAASISTFPPVQQRPFSVQPARRGICISEKAPSAVDLPGGDISFPRVLAREAAPPDVGKGAAAMVHTVVLKFGGSSIATAEKMKEAAKHVLSFAAAGEKPVVVFSAMGKTTNNLLLASEKAASCGVQARQIYEHAVIVELHLRTINELGLDTAVVSGSLDELARLLDFVAMPSELTPKTRHYFVSLGERMSAAIFSAYLNKSGRRARQVQFDAFDVDSEDFSNVDILKATYPVISKKLQGDWIDDPAIPIVTSFVGKVSESGAVTTLGSDLTAMIIGEALGSGEIQIWKDVDGVLTGDPNICANAILVPCLTFDEATELANAGAQVLNSRSMRLAMRGGIPVIIKNICNPRAPGTMITQTRDMSKSTLISIVVKSNILMLDIESKRMSGLCDFQAQVFSIFKDSSISIDYEANNRGGDMSLTLYPSKLYGAELMRQELDNVVEELEKIAVVHRRELKSIISLIGNVQKSPFIVGKAFNALAGIGVNVQKMSPRVLKNEVLNVSLVVAECEARCCVQVLHSVFLEDGFLSKFDGAENELPTLVNSPAPRGRSESDDAVPIAPELEEIERSLMSDNDHLMATDASWDPTGFFDGILGDAGVDPLHVGVENDDDPIRLDAGDPTEFYAAARDDIITPVVDGSVRARMITPDADDDITPVEFDDSGFIRLVDGEAQQQGLTETTGAGSGLDLDAVLQLEGPDIDEWLGTSSGSHAMSSAPPPPPFYS